MAAVSRTIVWFRRDLRIADHAPIYRAAMRGAVIPVFVFDRALLHHPEISPARIEFLLAALTALDQELRDRGGRLIVRFGDPVEVLPALIRETQADGIYAYLDFERIYGRVRDARLNRALAEQDLPIRWFEPLGSVPDLMPYPQYRDAWYAQMQDDRIPTPSRIEIPDDSVGEPIPTLQDLGHQPDGKPIPAASIHNARQLLHEFLAEKSDRYYWQLSYPSAEATTGLSPHLKFGVISIRECYQTAQCLDPGDDWRVARSQKQLISRIRWGSGFGQRFRYLPQLELRSLYSVFDEDGWAWDEGLYQAWQEGQTGFPIVDAAARCLKATGGWKELNFRSRALYSSFLSNLLGMDWRLGALHFMRHLIDGDCPIDHYQWAMQAGVTHCADKTWTRIYNPEQTAVDRCDPDGRFIKRWVPELAHLPAEQLGMPPQTKSYPQPIVDYKKARQARVKQLQHQRDRFLHQDNIVPYLARLPQNLIPFGADLHPSEIGWAQAPDLALFPTAIDLDNLDLEQAKALRTWFVAHVEIPAHKTTRRKPKAKPEPKDIQLNLL
jgi:deoxyribodipyrimidine photo-lyase